MWVHIESSWIECCVEFVCDPYPGQCCSRYEVVYGDGTKYNVIEHDMRKFEEIPVRSKGKYGCCEAGVV